MNDFIDLWKNKETEQGRIDITVFFVNVFLLLCHLFLLLLYVHISHVFMISVSVISIGFYIFAINKCYKNIDRYMGLAFLQIWIHLICGILSFGWTPCYQNWCFGILVAYFLPAFNRDRCKNKRPFFYAHLIIFTYFFLATFFPLVHLSITQELDIYLNSILFICNNLFVFITIILFALFYTNSSNRKENELIKKADYDELTELYNRHALNDIGDTIIKNAKESNKPYSVAILDIDFFKKINDKYGHNSGDMVLKKLANILIESSVKGIIPGRWGGEEFIFIAPHNIRYSEFTKILEKLRLTIKELDFEIENDKTINLTISIGSAKISDFNTLEDAIKIADVNLYKAKKTGRNKLIK